MGESGHHEPWSPGTVHSGIPESPELRSRGSPNPRNSGAGIPRNSGTPEPEIPGTPELRSPACRNMTKSHFRLMPKKVKVPISASRKKPGSDFGRAEKSRKMTLAESKKSRIRRQTSSDFPAKKIGQRGAYARSRKHLFVQFFSLSPHKQDHCREKKLPGDSISLGVYSEFKGSQLGLSL